jgi:hypothetical protein
MDECVLAYEASDLKAKLNQVFFNFKHFCAGLVGRGAYMLQMFQNDI